MKTLSLWSAKILLAVFGVYVFVFQLHSLFDMLHQKSFNSVYNQSLRDENSLLSNQLSSDGWSKDEQEIPKEHINRTLDKKQGAPHDQKTISEIVVKATNIDRLIGCRKLPDVLIIGFEKCGTVTLKSFLGIHPQVYVQDFSFNYKLFDKGSQVTTWKIKQYTRNKRCTPRGTLRLEKLSTRGVARHTHAVLPDIKLLAIVKEPVERSMSHYVHRKAKGIEYKGYTFDSMIRSILEHNKPIPLKGSVLFRQSTYVDRLEPWISAYGLEKIHIVDGDNFVKNPTEELQKVEQFLGLKSYISPNKFVYNLVKKFFCLKGVGQDSCMSSSKGRPHPSMLQTTRNRLQEYYRPYNEKLFKTIGHNFSWNGE